MALDPFFGVKFNGFRGPGYLFKAVFWLLGYVIDCINMVKGQGVILDLIEQKNLVYGG